MLKVIESTKVSSITSRDDSMMICHLAIVEHPLALRQLATYQRSCSSTHIRQIGDNARTLGIDIIRQETGIDTRIAGQFLLIQALQILQRRIGREAKLPIAINLKRREVIELWRLFTAAFLQHIFYN